MISMTELERMLFRCPEVNISKYPQASYEEFLLMDHDFSGEYVCVYPFVKMDESGTPYVEIYVWDSMLYPDIYESFIICEGMRLTDVLEEKLLNYCREPLLRIGYQRMDSFNSALLECFPRWHCIEYSAENIGRCIEHIYYASHHSGPREILYKAGLGNIAYNIKQLPMVNLVGSTVSAIVGHNLPIKLLRILDKPELIDVLYEEDSTEHALGVYRAYSSHIGKAIPSANQWRYLDELYSNGGKFAGMVFNRSLYKRLSHTDNEYILERYKRYFELYEELKINRRIRIPKADELWEATERLEYLQEYSDEREAIDAQFRSRKHCGRPVYEYSDNSYLVILPESCADICREAISQENCLMDYICRHASGETTILFLRKKDKPDESFVTMEVKDWQIKQVYGCCNTIPGKDVFQFLVEKYSRKKALFMDLDSMVDNYLDQEYEPDDELMEYLSGLLRSNNANSMAACNQDENEYIQLTLADMFPDVFDG